MTGDQRWKETRQCTDLSTLKPILTSVTKTGLIQYLTAKQTRSKTVGHFRWQWRDPLNIFFRFSWLKVFTVLSLITSNFFFETDTFVTVVKSDISLVIFNITFCPTFLTIQADFCYVEDSESYYLSYLNGSSHE